MDDIIYKLFAFLLARYVNPMREDFRLWNIDLSSIYEQDEGKYTSLIVHFRIDLNLIDTKTGLSGPVIFKLTDDDGYMFMDIDEKNVGQIMSYMCRDDLRYWKDDILSTWLAYRLNRD